MYLILLAGVAAVPAIVLSALTLYSRKKNKTLLEKRELNMALSSSLKSDACNVLSLGALYFRLPAVALAADILFVTFLALFGEKFDDFITFMFFSTVFVVSEFMIFRYLNRKIYIFGDCYAFSNTFGICKTYKYDETEIYMSKRFVVAHVGSKKISLSFSHINLEKFLLKCALNAELINKYR